MSQLVELIKRDDQYIGSIPDSIGNLLALVEVIPSNTITDVIPASMSNMAELFPSSNQKSAPMIKDVQVSEK